MLNEPLYPTQHMYDDPADLGLTEAENTEEETGEVKTVTVKTGTVKADVVKTGTAASEAASSSGQKRKLCVIVVDSDDEIE